MNTQERIERIVKDFAKSEIDKQILQLELETLVIQAQLEQLQKNNN